MFNYSMDKISTDQGMHVLSLNGSIENINILGYESQ